MTQTLEYLDFVLSIGSKTGPGQDYEISVSSELGRASATMTFPFDPATLEGHLKNLEIAVRQSASSYRSGSTTQQMTVPKLGEMLFKALFAGDVGELYRANSIFAETSSKGLRLKILVTTPDMAAVPWEYMYDPQRRNYVALFAHTPIVRYLDPPFVIQPQLVAPPLRILGMIASPRDLPELDVQSEKQRLDEAIAPLKQQGVMELTWVTGQTWDDLQDALRAGPWHIFHFAGHGGFSIERDEGYILLCDERQNARRFFAGDLRTLLQDHRTLRLVVLNACEGARSGDHDAFTSTASVLVNGDVPVAVLAMQYSISDKAAITLTRVFYKSLVSGLPVDAALADARKTIKANLPYSVEWGTPVLYTHARDGVIFDLSSAFRDRLASPDPKLPANQPLPEVTPPKATVPEDVTATSSSLSGSASSLPTAATAASLQPATSRTVIGDYQPAPPARPPDPPVPVQRDAEPTPLPPRPRPGRIWPWLVVAVIAMVIVAAIVRFAPGLTETDADRSTRSVTSTAVAGAAVLAPSPSPTSSPTTTRVVAVVVASKTPTRAATATPSPVPPTPTPPVQTTLTAPTVNLRAGPGSDYAILATWGQGTAMTVLGRSADSSWFSVEAPDGQIGWMAAAILGVVADAQALPVITPDAVRRSTPTGTSAVRQTTTPGRSPTAPSRTATSTPTTRIELPTATAQPAAPTPEPTQPPAPTSEPTLAPAPTPVDTPTPAPPPG